LNLLFEPDKKGREESFFPVFLFIHAEGQGEHPYDSGIRFHQKKAGVMGTL